MTHDYQKALDVMDGQVQEGIFATEHYDLIRHALKAMIAEAQHEAEEREMREAFEAWANNEGYDVTRPDIYEHRFLNALYEGWQAACEWKEKSK